MGDDGYVMAEADVGGMGASPHDNCASSKGVF